MVVRYERPLRPDELMHFGILGMKWGVRRFQNPDGSLTAAGRKRYGLGEKIAAAGDRARSKTYRMLNPKMSKAEADAYAKKNGEKIRKVAAVAGIAIGVSAAVYLGRKMGRSQFDRVIKQGMKIQTLHMDPDRMKAGSEFYAAHRGLDKVKYKAMFGEERGLFGLPTGNTKNKIVGEVAKDIKVAGRGNSKKAFNDLMKNDSEFKSAVTKATKEAREEASKWGIKVPKDDYDLFNQQILMGNDATVKNKFYGELKKRGYGGLADINDSKLNNFNTKADIIFDKDSIGKTTVTKLSAEELNKAKKANTAIQVGEMLAHPGNVATGGLLAYSIADSAATAKTQKDYNSKKKKTTSSKKKR